MAIPDVRFARNAMIWAAHLSRDDGGTAFVFMAHPGGQPIFQHDWRSPFGWPVLDPPEIGTYDAFKRFVTDRFGPPCSVPVPTAVGGTRPCGRPFGTSQPNACGAGHIRGD
jgi:hypothetical protein